MALAAPARAQTPSPRLPADTHSRAAVEKSSAPLDSPVAPARPVETLGSRLRSFFSFFNAGVPGNLTTAAILGLIGLWWGFHYRRFSERRRARDPENNHLWSVIGENAAKGQIATKLLTAINRAAAARSEMPPGITEPPAGPRRFAWLFEVKPSPVSSRRIWDQPSKYLWVAQRNFVAPTAKINDNGARSTGDAMSAVKTWVGECEDPATDEALGRISVRCAAGAGKSVFMHRLLLELTSSGLSPIPMLASAETLQFNPERKARLRATPDALDHFVAGWLKNRKITLPKKNRLPVIREFRNALAAGQIVLLLDGDDELKDQGLGPFAGQLLHDVRHWVVAHRIDPKLGTTERSVSLEDSWTEATILSHIDDRFPSASAITIKKVITEVLRRHNAAIQRAAAQALADGKPISAGGAHTEPHWLSMPRNLDLFLDAIAKEKLIDESDIRKRAESQSYLFGKIVEAAAYKIGATENLASIQDALCEIAVTDPTNTRRDASERTLSASKETLAQLRKLTELVGFSEKQGRFYFMQTALRAYYVAGQIARELLDPFHAVRAGDELARNETWDQKKRDAIESWLHKSGTDPAPSIAARLQRGQRHEVPLPALMKRNLLELLIPLRLPQNKKRANAEPFCDLDLSEIAGHQLDIHLLKFERCDFSHALLKDAHLTYATFNLCEFKKANLSDADAIAAVFNDCTFGADGADPANVKGLALDRAVFNLGGKPALLQRRLLLKDWHASLERSRYRGEFGKKFFAAQKAFLGPGVERLERDHYLRAIEEAIGSWMKKDSSSPIYLVDLMAGGSYGRITDLRNKFDRLHILGIDRDPSSTPVDSRFQWAKFEIGKDSTSDQVALGFDISSSLEEYFGKGAAPAHIIVAKKAFHEIDRAKQQLLIQECARALRPGGRLILFEDTPGIVEGNVPPDLSQTLAELDTLRHILGKDVDNVQRDLAPEPDDVVRALADLDYDTSAAELIGFANTWIMVKDWANLNRHEVRNRYFASVPEIKEWASGVFGAPRETKSDHYRLNPLIFNELGIQRALDHLTREGGNGVQVVDRDEAHLSEWIWDSERLKVLFDFTRKYLAPGAPLTKALDAKDESIDLTPIDPALALLNRSDITAPTFNLPCTVLVFEKN